MIEKVEESSVANTFPENYNRQHFIAAFDGMCQEVHKNAVDHGWWEEERSFPELVALMHSELSEALEAYRECKMDDKLPQHSGSQVELMDCVIRIMDFMGKCGQSAGKILVDKHEYNKTRPYRHGGKRA